MNSEGSSLRSKVITWLTAIHMVDWKKQMMLVDEAAFFVIFSITSFVTRSANPMLFSHPDYQTFVYLQ